MANSNAIRMRFMRFRGTYGYMGRALFARNHNVQHLCAFTQSNPFIGLVQGCIVSISRGSPPERRR